MGYEVVRRIQFCAGHRVHRHESKCAHPHGHNYVLMVYARPSHGKLDSIGRVIDFSVLKERVGGWIDTFWDHGFIYWKGDEQMAKLVEGFKSYELPDNPTAENMAKHLVEVVCPKLFCGTDVEVYKVTLWETENCRADYCL
jgi:6-pyruvoyltetrahydropterin/6-carboxytetrahydropterin synthase